MVRPDDGGAGLGYCFFPISAHQPNGFFLRFGPQYVQEPCTGIPYPNCSLVLGGGGEMWYVVESWGKKEGFTQCTATGQLITLSLA